jgi:hypothetical protein
MTISSMNVVKRDDQAASGVRGQINSGGRVDLSNFLGTWINTYKLTGSIRRFILDRNGEGYTIATYVSEGIEDLGTVEVVPFAPKVDSREADGFMARYDFEFLEMSLAAYYTKGLIVVSQYTRFKDGSGRPDYFNREFFFKAG